MYRYSVLNNRVSLIKIFLTLIQMEHKSKDQTETSEKAPLTSECHPASWAARIDF